MKRFGWVICSLISNIGTTILGAALFAMLTLVPFMVVEKVGDFSLPFDAILLTSFIIYSIGIGYLAVQRFMDDMKVI